MGQAPSILIYMIVKLLGWEMLLAFTYSRDRMATSQTNDNFRSILRRKPPRLDKYEMLTVRQSNFHVFGHGARAALYTVKKLDQPGHSI